MVYVRKSKYLFPCSLVHLFITLESREFEALRWKTSTMKKARQLFLTRALIHRNQVVRIYYAVQYLIIDHLYQLYCVFYLEPFKRYSLAVATVIDVLSAEFHIS